MAVGEGGKAIGDCGRESVPVRGVLALLVVLEISEPESCCWSERIRNILMK